MLGFISAKASRTIISSLCHHFASIALILDLKYGLTDADWRRVECATRNGTSLRGSCVHRIIGRLPDGKHKAEELAAAGLLQEAAECAARVRDGDMLTKLQDMIGTASPLGGAVSQLKDRLQAGVR